jgi:hypothetical protein
MREGGKLSLSPAPERGLERGFFISGDVYWNDYVPYFGQYFLLLTSYLSLKGFGKFMIIVKDGDTADFIFMRYRTYRYKGVAFAERVRNGHKVRSWGARREPVPGSRAASGRNTHAL